MIVDRLAHTNESGDSPVQTRPFAAAIGSFDGVHLGHQHLLRQVMQSARSISPRTAGFSVVPTRGDPRNEAAGTALGIPDSAAAMPEGDGSFVAGQSLVVTFEPLPYEVLHPDAPPGRLTDSDEREELLAAVGIDRVCVVNFTSDIAALPPARFLEMLRAQYEIRELWCGEDFAFGHNREGTVAFLQAHAEELGFTVHVIPRIDEGGARVGSRNIRSLLAQGWIENAAELLGHNPTVSGEVVEGAKRGRRLGYPTANVRVPRFKLIPHTGIYGGYAHLADEKHVAAISVGHNPTFGANPLTVEAYLLDFDREIYGERLEIEFSHRLREERKFDSEVELIEQMRRDVEDVRAVAGAAT